MVLGHRVREIRRQLGKTLREVGEVTGLSKSTLSKIENGTLSVSFDNLLKLAGGLAIDLSSLFAEGRGQSPGHSNGRRSVPRRGCGELYDTAMYQYEMLCADLIPRKMLPIVATLRAHSVTAAIELFRHAGEEFAYVLEGKVELRSEFYSPIELEVGDCVYFDSSMGHVLISAGDADAKILWVANTGAPNGDQASSKSSRKAKTSGRSKRASLGNRTATQSLSREVSDAKTTFGGSGAAIIIRFPTAPASKSR